jgi:hypothetical protein
MTSLSSSGAGAGTGLPTGSGGLAGIPAAAEVIIPGGTVKITSNPKKPVLILDIASSSSLASAFRRT